MNTLTTSKSSQDKAGVSRKLVEHAPGKNAWYQGYEMGMAFCRVTERLSSEPGSKVDKELRCLERTLQRGFTTLCPKTQVTLIDLGTGDGQKMVLAIKALNKAGIRPVRYLPVDTNPYISRYAILTILGSGKKAWNKQETELLFGPLGKLDLLALPNTDSISIETLVHLSDLHATNGDWFARNGMIVPMNGLTLDFFQDLPRVVGAAKRLDANAMNIFCLLGNTFGNYSAAKRTTFLTVLYNHMQAGELFLLGISLRPETEPCSSAELCVLENEYMPGEAFMRLGADHPASQYRSTYDSDLHCMIYTFQRPDTSIQHVGYSYLFSSKEVLNDLDTAGFEVLSCESYPTHMDAETALKIGYEPQYLTILVRKSQF